MSKRSTKCFDAESGQVYTERTCSAGPSRSEWIRNNGRDRKKLARYRSRGPGCPSLRDMSIRAILANSSNLDPDTLKEVPLRLAMQIWKMAKRHRMNSLQLWKIFVPSVGNQGDDEMRYKRLALPDKSGRLSDGIKPMTSPSFAWITFLSLANICCTRAELIRISRVANLGMLTINPLYGEYFGEEIGLDNSLVRAWGRAAFEAGAFSKLRILVLNDVTCRFLTNSVFKYLREFPALGMLLVPADFQDIFDDAAVAHGWYRIKNSDLFRTRFESENCTWQDIYTDCFNDDGTVDLVKLENLQSPDGNAPPVLDVIYGNTKNDPYSKLIPRNDIGKETLQIFVRRDRTVRILNDDKKRIRPTYEDADHSWFKKRAMRSSKQQHIGALLADFDK